jgi:hypothetical protein
VNLGNLAIVVHARGDSDKAATLFEESLTLAREFGDSFLISEALGARRRTKCNNDKQEAANASPGGEAVHAGDHGTGGGGPSIVREVARNPATVA